MKATEAAGLAIDIAELKGSGRQGFGMRVTCTRVHNMEAWGMFPETDGNGRGRTLKNGTTRACYYHFLAAVGACEGWEGWSEKETWIKFNCQNGMKKRPIRCGMKSPQSTTTSKMKLYGMWDFLVHVVGDS